MCELLCKYTYYLNTDYCPYSLFFMDQVEFMEYIMVMEEKEEISMKRFYPGMINKYKVQDNNPWKIIQTML